MGPVRITARVDYAVRAAVELAAVAPDALTCDRIARAQDVPARFLQGILGDLQHARLVTSQRGREGGYRLALPPSEISIARVMRVEQGFLAEVHGQRPEDVSYPGVAAELAGVWVAAREAYRRGRGGAPPGGGLPRGGSGPRGRDREGTRP